MTNFCAKKDDAGWRPMLEARPLHNAVARVEKGDGPGMTVHVKTDRPRYMVPPLSWVVPFREERRVCLDRVGTWVWELCDGRRTVEDMIDAFADRYGLTFHEARIAVTGYIRSLVQRGVLAMALQDES
jgi:hypothetical protein